MRKLLFVAAIASLFSASVHGEDEKTIKAPACCGVTFTAVKCSCAADSPPRCSCTKCTRDEHCACIVALKKGTGVIAGTVNSRYVRKHPTVVYIDSMPGRSYAPPENPVRMDQMGKAFNPQVLPAQIGTTVKFSNSDDFEHNVFSPDGEKYNLGNWQKGEARSYTFRRPGAYVQLCSIHPEMVGYVLVTPTPYSAVVGKDGKFKISNVPPGKWKLKVWNERLRKKSLARTFDVEVAADGTASVELKP